jgi:hypothetical protein
MNKSQKNLVERISVLIVGAIVILSVLIISGIIPLDFSSQSHSGASFTPPSQIPYGGSFVEISNMDLAGQNTVGIYFDSWIGCPIGAANSWVIYGTLSSYVNNLATFVSYHYSDPNEGSVANIPGILFKGGFEFNESGISVKFTPLYMYNETLFGYPYTNTPIVSGQVLSVGYQETNSSGSFPASIAHLVYEYTAVIPVLGSHGIASAYLGKPPHVNTVLIISGKAGTFMLNGPFYSPANLKGLSYSYMEEHYSTISYVTSAMNLFNGQIQNQL